MKENVKMKENMPTESMGAMPKMPSAPNILPVQSNPMGVMPVAANQMGMMPDMANQMGVMPATTNQMDMMPSMMNQMPVMCCPFLMNMQCPMTHGQSVMGMNMMNNPMLSGTEPFAGNVNPMMGVGNAMNPMLGAGNAMNPMRGMGMMPSMNPYYPMGGM